MPKIVKVKRSNVAGATPVVSYGELAWNAADGRLFVGNAANQPIAVGASGGGGASGGVYEFATAASFPSVGQSGVLYVATDHGRIYRYDASGVYVELGPQ